MSHCPGPCNAARRRDASQDARDRTARAVPVEGEPVWCRRCRTLIGTRLAELDDLAALLGAAGGGRRPGVPEKVSGSRAAASPSPVADDLDELIRTLLSWEDAYREDRALGPRPRRGRYAPTLSKCLAWLGAHLDGLLRFPGAEDFGAEVLDLHRRLKGRTTGGGPRRATPLPCPRCDLLTLAHDVVAERVRCRQCRWSATVEEYEAYSRRRAS